VVALVARGFLEVRLQQWWSLLQPFTKMFTRHPQR
jgi:hypothetical protein